jgi:hypothetical protein
MRDTQRSKVYAWERRFMGSEMFFGTMKSIEEVEQFLKPIWRSERGRYGLANRPMPTLIAGRGARGSIGSITLGRWARNPWVILHETAHALTPKRYGGWHGPRFVGILIGLAARHLGHDAYELMALADEMGVKYHVRSIGAVPVKNLSDQIVTVIQKQGPLREMEIAAEVNENYRRVRGAALFLIRHGRARWHYKRLHLI